MKVRPLESSSTLLAGGSIASSSVFSVTSNAPEAKKTWPQRIGAFFGGIYKGYVHVVLDWPKLCLLATISISVALSAIAGATKYGVIDFTPSKGFETRGTHWANVRLSLTSLPTYAASLKEIIAGRVKREVNEVIQAEVVNDVTSTLTTKLKATTEEAWTVDYADYGVDSEPWMADVRKDPCVQFAGLGTEIPYDYVDLFAKLTFEAPSIDELFSLPTMRALCELDTMINETQGREAIKSTLSYAYNLPLYSTCLNISSPKTCDALNQPDIDHLKKTLISCKEGWGSDPALCELKLIQTAISYLLPKEITAPLVFNVFLPVFAASNNGRTGFEFFMSLKQRIIKELSEHVTLKGTYFLTKDAEFVDVLAVDCALAGASALLVFLVLFSIVRSTLFTAAVILLLALSFGLAFFLYTVVLAFPFYPFVNLLSLALMISLAADDAFVMVVFYREEAETGKHATPKDALARSLSHSLATVTVTSFTTAIAFAVNLFSDVLIMRCFGIFASLVVLSNLLLLYVLLPPALLLCTPFIPVRPVSTRISDFFASLASKMATVLYALRYPLAVLFLALMGGCAVVTFVTPALKLPESVNVQLLNPSHTEEWFDRNSKLFNLSAHRTFSLIQNIVFGVDPVMDASLVDPNDSGKFAFDPRFKVATIGDLHKLQDLSIFLLHRAGLRADTTLWIDLFMSWIASPSTISECRFNGTDDVSLALPPVCFLAYAQRFPVAKFPSDWTTFPIDGPLFDKSLRFKGYFFGMPSKFKWSLDWDDLQAFFADNDKLQGEVAAYEWGSPATTSSSTQILRIFDLLVRSLPSTMTSLAIALGLCLVLVLLGFLLAHSTITTIALTLLGLLAILVLLGWRLGVIESSIIILATGVAFDYVLHYAVAYRLAPPLPYPAKMRGIHESAGAAVLGGASTALAAAIPLLFAQTSAFAQLGTFLAICSILSLLAACIVFPTFQAVLSPLERTPMVLKF